MRGDLTYPLMAIFWLCWGFNTSTLVGLCCLPEKGRREIVEEMKERDRRERKQEAHGPQFAHLHICKCHATDFQYCHSNMDTNLTIP